ncbi:MAG: bifunctional methylenetetrahydrofolate dehydrogenase/methenyltetrahydrofolate cyclohydrolase FolD [Methylobacteriaceae bacterium]|jgi:methylenetetrahydrofolate dehydrogenase (NADP+)/methenyltetrahydrofolate cyclohydrolase|nr:bifunctional methylenetetrahydrofolate dehydrogenase/methenyltetrahydrofolate cyclohydrolase FolD [Methylobacteriaceae bacterium]
MPAHLIDGKAEAAKLHAAVTTEVSRLAEKGVVPGLAVVLVGEDPASRIYVRNKAARTRETGMRSIEHKLPAQTTEPELLALIRRLNTDPLVDGILVQLPLPGHINERIVLEAIDPGKDVDGFHPVNVGRLVTGVPGLVPCTPLGCMILLKSVLSSLNGLQAVVIGRSNIVGKPVAHLLLRENCTVTIAHSKTRDLPDVCAAADILVAAVGRPELVKGSWVKRGATVIDVGINRVADPAAPDAKPQLVGDVDFADVFQVAGALTPVPGGVGPMTIACLLRNTVYAACMRRDWAVPAL